MTQRRQQFQPISSNEPHLTHYPRQHIYSWEHHRAIFPEESIVNRIAWLFIRIQELYRKLNRLDERKEFILCFPSASEKYKFEIYVNDKLASNGDKVVLNDKISISITVAEGYEHLADIIAAYATLMKQDIIKLARRQRTPDNVYIFESSFLVSDLTQSDVAPNHSTVYLNITADEADKRFNIELINPDSDFFITSITNITTGEPITESYVYDLPFETQIQVNIRSSSYVSGSYNILPFYCVATKVGDFPVDKHTDDYIPGTTPPPDELNAIFSIKDLTGASISPTATTIKLIIDTNVKFGLSILDLA